MRALLSNGLTRRVMFDLLHAAAAQKPPRAQLKVERRLRDRDPNHRSAAGPFNRRCTRITVTADHRLPVGVAILRAFSSMAMAFADLPASSSSTGRSASARALASSRFWTPLALRPPSLTPCAFLAASASRVRWLISRRSFSASAAYRCSMNGSASAPNSATMNGVLWLIRPEMKWTSRLKRSSLATIIGGLELPGCGQGRRELRPAVERVSARPGLDLGERLQEVVALGLGEAGERGLLRLEARARSAPGLVVETRV